MSGNAVRSTRSKEPLLIATARESLAYGIAKVSKSKNSVGFIHADEAYAKGELMRRLGISQKFWDKMLDEGLPYANIGHARWITGRSVIEYIERTSERKHPQNGEAT